MIQIVNSKIRNLKICNNTINIENAFSFNPWTNYIDIYLMN
jgi:hypothetical protein